MTTRGLVIVLALFLAVPFRSFAAPPPPPPPDCTDVSSVLMNVGRGCRAPGPLNSNVTGNGYFYWARGPGSYCGVWDTLQIDLLHYDGTKTTVVQFRGPGAGCGDIPSTSTDRVDVSGVAYYTVYAHDN